MLEHNAGIPNSSPADSFDTAKLILFWSYLGSLSEPSLISHRGAVRYTRTVLDLNSVTPLCFSEHLHQMSPSPSFLVRRGLRELLARTHTHATHWGLLLNCSNQHNSGSSASKLRESRGAGVAFANTMFNKNAYLLLLTKSTIQVLYSLENRNV